MNRLKYFLQNKLFARILFYGGIAVVLISWLAGDFLRQRWPNYRAFIITMLCVFIGLILTREALGHYYNYLTRRKDKPKN
jgi:thiol:disulfide interchange protein